MRNLSFLKLAGWTAVICAPAMWIDLAINGLYDQLSYNWTEALFSLIYLLGWIALLISLYQVKAAGIRWWGKLILSIQLALFIVSALSNIMALTGADHQSAFFNLIDACWPVGQFFLLVTGLFIGLSNQIKGWKRCLPFAAGLFFPIVLLLSFFPQTHDNYLRHAFLYITPFGLLSTVTMWGVAVIFIKEKYLFH